MTTSRPFRAASLGRAAPARRTTPFALAALALLTFAFEGCASLGLGNGGGCGTASLGKCGGCNTCGFGGLFHHKNKAVPAYEGGVATEGVPMGVPMDGMPAGGMPSALPSNEDPQLTPAPTGPTGSVKKSSASGLGSNASMGKAYYQAEISGVRGGPKEARRSSSASLPTLAGGISAPGPDDPLANLPEPSNPSETASEASPPKAPTAGEPPASTAPKLVPTPSSNSAELLPKPAEPAGATSMAPGIRRFKVLEPNLAAGSLPNDSGWAWLVEKGYKTVLDLREPGEIKQEELAAIDHYGLRHVSLACSSTRIDPARVKRFASEIALETARPMFIFDADGTRPAAMYFVHEVATVKKESKIAEREVEDLGASETPLWRLAGEFVAKLAAPAPVAVPSASLPPTAPTSPEVPLETVKEPFVEGVAQLPPAPKADPSATPRQLPGAWKPMVTLVLTTLGLPLAYLGRSALSWGGRALASLPAPARSPKQIASASGE